MQNPERWLGDILSAAITAANGVLVDPLLAKSLNRIKADLFIGGAAPRILVLDTAVINAWTLPGNTVLITRGLIQWAETDDILAGIIAHELGHVERHHAWRQLSQSILLKLLIDRIPVNGRSLRMVLNGISILIALGWSRAHELEADKFATERLLKSGYMHDAWWRFLDASSKSSVFEELLSTHPSDNRRLSHLQMESAARQERKAPSNEADALRAYRLGFPSIGSKPRQTKIDPPWDAMAKYRVRLRKTFAPQALIGPIQRLLVWNVPVNDIAVLIVAGHVFSLQEQLSDILATLSSSLYVIDSKSASRITPLIDRAINGASHAQQAIGLVLADVQTRLSEPHPRALVAKGARFAVREGLLLKAQQEIDAAYGAIYRLDEIVSRIRLARAETRLATVLAYNGARDVCASLLRRDGIDVPQLGQSSEWTIEILRKLLSVEHPSSHTGFAYVDTLNVGIDAAVEQGSAWSVARYLDALSAELEGIKR